jgi:hypothetical protein
VKKPHVLFRVAAVLTAVVLSGGFVAYRAGAFGRLLVPVPPPPQVGGSEPVPVVPETFTRKDNTFEFKGTINGKWDKTLFSGSKSARIEFSPPPATSPGKPASKPTAPTPAKPSE